MRMIITLLMSLLIVACASSPTTVENKSNVENEGKSLLLKQYYIGVDDLLQISVWKHEDLSISVPVRPDGKISVPLIGEVMAGGRRPADVAEDIKLKLSKYIKQPNVAVILVELRSHEYLSRVRITGAVTTPLSINFRQGMTVLDAVLAAGGINDFASANNTKLLRRVGGQVREIEIDLEDILSGGDIATNLPLQPGDILSVPERIF